MSKVRQTCLRVLEKAKHVKVESTQINALAQIYQREPEPWSSFEFHYTGINKVDYIFAMDALNFCFWTHDSYDYPDLARNLKQMMEANPQSLSPSSISTFSVSDMCQIFPNDFPDLQTRLSKLVELGQVTCEHFSGSYTKLLESCENSSMKLLDLIFDHFPGFRDVFDYEGEEVFLMKRAQILICDLFAAGCWEFNDMEFLTMFPDYQVPQVLNSKGVLKYSDQLQQMVDNLVVIEKGSEFEVEIRAATVVACDELAKIINQPVYKVDWLLWQIGESEKKAGLLKPHHRTLTTFY